MTSQEALFNRYPYVAPTLEVDELRYCVILCKEVGSQEGCDCDFTPCAGRYTHCDEDMCVDCGGHRYYQHTNSIKEAKKLLKKGYELI